MSYLSTGFLSLSTLTEWTEDLNAWGKKGIVLIEYITLVLWYSIILASAVLGRILHTLGIKGCMAKWRWCCHQQHWESNASRCLYTLWSHASCHERSNIILAHADKHQKSNSKSYHNAVNNHDELCRLLEMSRYKQLDMVPRQPGKLQHLALHYSYHRPAWVYPAELPAVTEIHPV